MSEIKPLRVLVLGGLGMLGHRLMLTLSAAGYEVIGTTRQKSPLVDLEPMVWINLTHRDHLEREIRFGRFDVVINCAGRVRQRHVASWAETITVNAVLPHWLAGICEDLGTQLVHISTDCVGDTDWYGVTKRLGEPHGQAIILRTSFIGHQLSGQYGLLEWFLSGRDPVDGFAGVLWNGLTTNELARVIGEHVIPRAGDLAGRTWEVCGWQITKYELLQQIDRIYELGREVRPMNHPTADRRLDGRVFAATTGYEAPSWPVMLQQMHQERVMQVQERSVA